jgi:hypothetical protein
LHRFCSRNDLSSLFLSPGDVQRLLLAEDYIVITKSRRGYLHRGGVSI